MNGPYCSRCGTLLGHVLLAGRQRQQCPACGSVAWRNPTPVGAAVITHRGQLVLIRRRDPPLADYWAPPAGYVECGESVPQAVVREAREECGLDIELDGMIGVYSQGDVDVLLLAYRAHSTGGELQAGDDASDAALFGPDALPRQARPRDGTAIDLWLHAAIQSMLDHWRRDAPPDRGDTR